MGMAKSKVDPITAREAFEEASKFARLKHWDSYQPKLRPKQVASEVVLAATDLHYGVVIDGREVPGNAVDSQVMARRTAFLATRLADYKPHKSRVCRILLGGDIIEGEIHGRGTDEPLAQQIYNAQHCLHGLINTALAAFGQVVVECATGNHDRWSHRGHGRVVDGKWDSLSTLVYAWLAGVHSRNKAVTFNIPKAPYTVWRSLGGTPCVLTHGDTVFNIGNPASGVNYKRVREQANSLSKIVKRTHGGDLGLVVLGHHHSPAIFAIDDFYLAINGCLSGISSYSQSLGYHVGTPRQLIFEQTDTHVMGHPEFVDVNIGDTLPEMSKIISTPGSIAT